MSSTLAPRWWVVLLPLAGAALLLATLLLPLSGPLVAACALALVGAAVHHAEVVAHRVGEPFGTLVLAVAITVIEVALIVSLMRAGGADTATLPRDTVYAAVMIICTGVVGICLLAGGLSHHEQTFKLDGTHSALSALVVVVGLAKQVCAAPPQPAFSRPPTAV